MALHLLPCISCSGGAHRFGMNFESKPVTTISLRDRATVQLHLAAVFARSELGKSLKDAFGNDVYDLDVLRPEERNEVMEAWATRYGERYSNFADQFPERIVEMLTPGSGVSAVNLFHELTQKPAA